MYIEKKKMKPTKEILIFNASLLHHQLNISEKSTS